MIVTRHTPPARLGGLDATVIVGTFGGDGWVDLANQRAIPSALALGLPVIHCHAPTGTLAEARNQGVDLVETGWLIVLDADDCLGGGFSALAARAVTPDVDVLIVKVVFVHPDGSPGVAHWPRVAGHVHDCEPDCLPFGNWLIVGCPVRTELAQRIRWGEWERFEDWSWWLSCWQAGARFGRAPDAVYVAHVRAESRNQRHVNGIEVHRAIARHHGVPVP